MIESNAAADPFAGKLLVAAPHMDDEALACGALIARAARESRVHVVFATDGAMSPVPPFGSPDARLPGIRRGEAVRAMAELGVRERNLTFLNHRDGRLSRSAARLAGELRRLVGRICPDHVLVPFRYDRHPDHIALNRAAFATIVGIAAAPQLSEYFVYYRSRLLRAGDVRRYIRPELLIREEVGEEAEAKRQALMSYESQVSRYFDWQRRPILTPSSIDESCRGPEVFLRRPAGTSQSDVFSRGALWVRLAHAVEPKAKRVKDGAVRLVRAVTRSREP